MKCPKCNAELSDKSKFCTHCGTKIENNLPKAVFCSKCGAQLKDGAKFCSKCGNSQNAQPAQDTQSVQNTQSTPSMQAPRKAAPQQTQPPVQNTAPQPAQAPVSMPNPSAQQAQAKQAPKKKSKLPVVLIIIVLLIALLVGGYFVLDKVFDINPIALITGNEEDDDDSRDSTKSDDDDGNVEDNKDNKDEEADKVDPEELEALKEQIKTAKKSYDEGSFEDALKESKEVIEQYIALSEKYTLDEEAGEQIVEAYDIAAQAATKICEGLEGQEYGNALYKQMRNTLDPVLELAVTLTEKGYEVDSTGITKYSDGIVPKFRDVFIKKINEITEREQWSRDEAWTYAEAAYSIQEDGKTVLFDESDLDDPLRLRYVYCLAWIQRKRCENGVADGSMTQKDAFDAMAAILEETDYNLLVLQDIIAYGNAIEADTSGYQAAYDAIVQELKDEQKLSIVNSGVNSGTSVDVRKFWYFNNLSGDDAYKVDINNGTTQNTRDWIRENIPSYID